MNLLDRSRCHHLLIFLCSPSSSFLTIFSSSCFLTCVVADLRDLGGVVAHLRDILGDLHDLGYVVADLGDIVADLRNLGSVM